MNGRIWPTAAGWSLLALALVLVVVFLVLQQMGRRLPYGVFFVGTASLLLVVSLVFAGKGALFLQMAGWLPSTDWTAVPLIGWLGVYPLRETVLAQLLVVSMIAGLVLWGSRSARA